MSFKRTIDQLWPAFALLVRTTMLQNLKMTMKFCKYMCSRQQDHLSIRRQTTIYRRDLVDRIRHQRRCTKVPAAYKCTTLRLAPDSLGSIRILEQLVSCSRREDHGLAGATVPWQVLAAPHSTRPCTLGQLVNFSNHPFVLRLQSIHVNGTVQQARSEKGVLVIELISHLRPKSTLLSLDLVRACMLLTIQL